MKNRDPQKKQIYTPRAGSFEEHIYKTMLSFGIEQFAYYVENRRNSTQPVIFSNYPKNWLSLYREKHLHSHDPVIRYAYNSVRPFSWSDAINEATNQELSFLNQASTFFHHNGYTFTLNDAKGNIALLSVSNPSGKKRFNRLVERYKSILQMSLIELHHDYLLNYSKRPRNTNKSRRITEREKEILRWSCKGKTYAEISLIIGVTERTIKFHMSNVVKKLNVTNTKEAIFTANKLNII
ncbi:MAG: LuxR family transcriptional regulator [Candidatus Schmidhempelia sp.]|nr:LuxR family transcriptional regulator [Candidatus Schmidhempelia sp.]